MFFCCILYRYQITRVLMPKTVDTCDGKKFFFCFFNKKNLFDFPTFFYFIKEKTKTKLKRWKKKGKREKGKNGKNGKKRGKNHLSSHQAFSRRT